MRQLPRQQFYLLWQLEKTKENVSFGAQNFECLSKKMYHILLTWSAGLTNLKTCFRVLEAWCHSHFRKMEALKVNWTNLLHWNTGSQSTRVYNFVKHVYNFVKPVHHVSKTCYISLTNIHSFVLQTKHNFHWSSQHSCLGYCLVRKINE